MRRLGGEALICGLVGFLMQVPVSAVVGASYASLFWCTPFAHVLYPLLPSLISDLLPTRLLLVIDIGEGVLLVTCVEQLISPRI